MFDNYIDLYLRGTRTKIEIKRDSSTNELYNKIIGKIDDQTIKLLVYKNKPIKNALNITLRDYNIQNNSYIELKK